MVPVLVLAQMFPVLFLTFLKTGELISQFRKSQPTNSFFWGPKIEKLNLLITALWWKSDKVKLERIRFSRSASISSLYATLVNFLFFQNLMNLTTDSSKYLFYFHIFLIYLRVSVRSKVWKLRVKGSEKWGDLRTCSNSTRERIILQKIII